MKCMKWRKRNMDFGKFIKAFGTGYNKIDDPERNKTLNKPYFCRELLCRITKNEVVVKYIDGVEDKKHERSESAFNSFYRNFDRRSLHPIAEPILNSNDIDKKKFKHFLEMYTQHYSKDKLLNNFKKELPDVSYSTLFDDITNELVLILTKAAAEPDKRLKATVSTNKSASLENNNESVEAKMNAMLNKLIKKGRRIAEFKVNGIEDRATYSALKNSLHKDFEQLTILSESLSEDNETADSSIVDEIVDLITILEETDFILTANEYIIESMKNYRIHRLSDLIAQLQ